MSQNRLHQIRRGFADGARGPLHVPTQPGSRRVTPAVMADRAPPTIDGQHRRRVALIMRLARLRRSRRRDTTKQRAKASQVRTCRRALGARSGARASELRRRRDWL